MSETSDTQLEEKKKAGGLSKLVLMLSMAGAAGAGYTSDRIYDNYFSETAKIERLCFDEKSAKLF